MMTYTMQEADLLSDERLVGLTLEGDRDAFGQIVARYQSAICALAYSACGCGSPKRPPANAFRADGRC
jgi:hypothetical protein